LKVTPRPLFSAFAVDPSVVLEYSRIVLMKQPFQKRSGKIKKLN
jgi:hypothetical protein